MIPFRSKMRIDKQPVACCYLGELRQRQAFLLHDLCTQEPIVSRARGADRIDLNRIERWHSRRPQGHSNNSASLPSTNAKHPSTLDQDRSRMHSMPSPRSRVLHQATPMVTIHLSATAAVHLGHHYHRTLARSACGIATLAGRSIACGPLPSLARTAPSLESRTDREDSPVVDVDRTTSLVVPWYTLDLASEQLMGRHSMEWCSHPVSVERMKLRTVNQWR